MKYKAILRDSVIMTDDYEDNEFGTLVKNIKRDLDELEVDYPVNVRNELDKKVFTLFPVSIADK